MEREEYEQLDKTLDGLVEAALADARAEMDKRNASTDEADRDHHGQRTENALGRADGLSAARRALMDQFRQ